MAKAREKNVEQPRSTDRQRLPAELQYADQLAILRDQDEAEKPAGWALSPRALRSFIAGEDQPRKLADGRSILITRKFFGDDALIERAIITLATDRGLMLIGEPGTAKSLLSELLAAGVSQTSLLTIQGSAATTEDHIRYSWNYALLLSKGPTQDSLVPAPFYLGMTRGKIVRFEEITRCPLEVQDVIVPILSERLMLVPELEGEAGVVYARPGFNVIATANTRDRGVNEMSAALKRRFNFETISPIPLLREEVELVHREVERQLRSLELAVVVDQDVTALLVQTFHELRSGRTEEGTSLEQPSSVLSTAEAVAVTTSAALHAKYYGDSKLKPEDLARHLVGSAIKEPDDRKAVEAYFRAVGKERAKSSILWRDYLSAAKTI